MASLNNLVVKDDCSLMLSAFPSEGFPDAVFSDGSFGILGDCSEMDLKNTFDRPLDYNLDDSFDYKWNEFPTLTPAEQLAVFPPPASPSSLLSSPQESALPFSLTSSPVASASNRSWFNSPMEASPSPAASSSQSDHEDLESTQKPSTTLRTMKRLAAKPGEHSPTDSIKSPRSLDSSSSGISKHKQPRRMPHNEVERRYREGINYQLDRLRRTLPNLYPRDPDGLTRQRASKATILANAIDYIKQLEETQEKLLNELEKSEGIRRFVI